ncbi:MAG: phosphotriesterase family protein, partial [Planctomycetota bacterium]
EILVARGTYRPDEGLGAAPEFDWRTTTFQLVDGVVLRGGYAGSGAPDPNERDVGGHQTILSGDLRGDDGPEFSNRDDNSYQVVTITGPAVLEGVTVTAGYASAATGAGADDPILAFGGGLLVIGRGATVRDCLFEDNFAQEGGGGLYAEQAEMFLEGCTFEGNRVGSDSSSMEGCGGAIMLDRVDAVVSNCLLRRNEAVWGGGICSFHSRHVELVNCLMLANTAVRGGGAFYSEGGFVKVVNCTAAGNRATEGSFLKDVTFPVRGQQTPWILLDSCILADGGTEISNSAAVLTIQYTDVVDGMSAVSDPQHAMIWGLGNIAVDPLFAEGGYWVDADDPNVVVEPNDPNAEWIDGRYHLKSRAGRYDPNTQTWVQDDVTNPCIDAGNPATSFENEPAPNGAMINMGAYGGTFEASKSEYSWSFVTTQGPVPAEGLGIVLPHEHIFTDLRGPTTPGYGQANAADVVRVMAPLLTEVRQKGVGLMFECSSIGVGRNAPIIAQVAQAAGLPVVVPTGVYGRANFAPPQHRNMSEDELTTLFADEIQQGIEGTGIKAGFIKIATGSGSMTALEDKFLRAAGRAASQTGAAIASHTPVGANATRQADILASISPDIRLIWVHAQNTSDRNLHRQLAARGVFIEFDSLGWNPGQDSTFIAAIKDLLAAGHGDRILLSHDAGWYRPGEPNGGSQKPYTYLMNTFIAKLSDAGVDDATIRMITEINPIRAFAFKSVIAGQ